MHTKQKRHVDCIFWVIDGRSPHSAHQRKGNQGHTREFERAVGRVEGLERGLDRRTRLLAPLDEVKEALVGLLAQHALLLRGHSTQGSTHAHSMYTESE